MPVEKSAGAVVFYRNPDGKIEYLLIQNSKSKTWGFPKGVIDSGEKLEEAALREAKEEAGLENLILIDGFKETSHYFLKAKYDYQIKMGFKIGQTVLKFVTYFLAETKNKEVKLSFEHSDYAWLEIDEASEKLSGDRSLKEILKKAQEFLSKK